MKALGVYDALQAEDRRRARASPRPIQFVDTRQRRARLRRALADCSASTAASRWLVPAKPLSAIRQDAVLLKTGADDEAAEGLPRVPARDPKRAPSSRNTATGSTELNVRACLADSGTPIRLTLELAIGHDACPARRRDAARLVAGALARRGGRRSSRRSSPCRSCCRRRCSASIC